MKQSKILQERVRRVKAVFAELGCSTTVAESTAVSYSGVFKDRTGMEAGFFIDDDCRFLELAFGFEFPEDAAPLIHQRLESLMRACWEYGTYFMLDHTPKGYILTLFNKLYFTGLSYYSLRDTMRDFRLSVVEAAGICGKLDSLDDITQHDEESEGGPHERP